MKRITTPLDYAREVLGRLPSQGIRMDIVVDMAKDGVDVTGVMTQKAVILPLPEPEAAVETLVEGEYTWL